MNFCKSIPKIELHCHLDGSVRPKTIWELGKNLNLSLPAQNVDELRPHLQAPPNCPSLKVYLERFRLPLLVMQTRQNLIRITNELLSDAAMDGVKYIEIRFAPHLHMAGGLSFEEVVSAVLEPIATSYEKWGIYSNLILCCMRHSPLEKSIEVVERGRSFLQNGVVAVDLAGNEADFPPELHERAFQLAKKYGYQITIHAGETGIGTNVQTAIEKLHANRIGHGLFCTNAPKAYQLVRDLSIPLELCPKSNVDTGAVSSYAAHPFERLFQEGICVTVNTDNVTVSDVSWSQEWQNIAEHFHFGFSEMKQLYLNSVESSFASSSVKHHLKTFV